MTISTGPTDERSAGACKVYSSIKGGIIIIPLKVLSCKFMLLGTVQFVHTMSVSLTVVRLLAPNY